MRKKLAVLCGAFLLTMLLTISASAAAPRFEDVSADTPYAESILYLADHGITNGTDSRLFSPDAQSRPANGRCCSVGPMGWRPMVRRGQNRAKTLSGRCIKRDGGGNSALRSVRMCRGAFYKSALLLLA